MRLFEQVLPVTEDILPGVMPYYYVTKGGQVYSVILRGMMKQFTSSNGYMYVTLAFKDGVSKHVSVHRLVMLTYKPISNPDEMDVDHLYGDKTNNDADNMEWVTHSDNIKRSYDTGLRGVGEIILCAINPMHRYE